jgi:hypothetical protein
MVQGRYVMVGDHTNQPKEGQRMPEVITIHQNSETSSKPSYFRGHIWAFIGLVVEKAQKYYAVPLLGEMNIGKRNDKNSQTMGTRIVNNALSIAEQMNCCIYLVLDAFFAIGPVFLAASAYSIAFGVPWVHIITRAKKSTVAYLDPEPTPPGKRGRKKQYGEKMKLKKIFEHRSDECSKAQCFVYGHMETIKILCLDLLWKPIKGKIRFIFAITSRGPIIVMCSDLTLPPSCILELYCRRSAIENTFSVLKNQIGGLAYHFWSKLIEKLSRRPKKNKGKNSAPQDVPVEAIRNKVRAIEMFVNLSAILVGILQILALSYPEEIWRNNTRWLRTYSNAIPSEYIVRGVLVQKILLNLHKVNTHAIYALVRSRQSRPSEYKEF